MSHYLIDQLGDASEHRRSLTEREVVLRTRRDEARGDRHPNVVRRAGGRACPSDGLYIFIGADAETGWLPPEIALDQRGYVLTGTDVSAAGRLGARP